MASLPQFDYLRQKAQQQSTAQTQEEEDALKRRLATAGALNTGAAVKQQSIQQENAINRRAQALQDIDFQEQAAKQQQEEIEKGRQFQTSERLGSQSFAAEQAGLGRQFQTSERLGGQEFSALQRAAAEKFGTSEREASQGFSSSEADKARASQEKMFNQNYLQHQKEFEKTFKLTEDQAKQKMEIDQAMLGMARDQAEADKLTTLMNYATTLAGPDASPEEVNGWLYNMKKWVAENGGKINANLDPGGKMSWRS